MRIIIDDQIHRLAPDLALGVLTANVKVTQHEPNLWREIAELTTNLRAGLTTDQVSALREVAAMRELYRRLGVDPNRYRGSAEALLRRLTQGKDLYRVNSVVDINNLTSIVSRHPVGSYDLEQVTGPVVFRPGRMSETYPSIGKGEICLERIPLFVDDAGPFGNPTSDSERTKIRANTSHVAVVVIAACESESLSNQLVGLANLLEQYSAATDVLTEVCKRID